MNKHTKVCPTCSRNITTNNYNRHINACQGTVLKKIRGVDFDPNHGFKNGTRTAWNKGLTKDTDKRVESYSLSLKNKLDRKIGGCFAWTPEQRSINAKQLGLGGYRENAGTSKKFRLLDSFGTPVCLQSSYELNCANILDEMFIDWIRPKHLKYDTKNYFPDFYLVKYNIYLDTKNDYLIKIDKDKIQKVVEQNNVTIYVLSKEQITKEYIASLI